jgi:hypothetical protein
LNELRFKYGELDLIKEISEEGAVEFNIGLKEYCKAKDIDSSLLYPEESQPPPPPKHVEEPEDKHEETSLTKSEHEGHVENKEETPESDEVVEIEVKKEFKDLFRKLAAHLHPDKLSGLSELEVKERTELFKKAKEAVEQERFFFLLDLADKFKVRTPKDYDRQLRWMKNKNKELGKELTKQKSTFNYMFTECETEAEKERLYVAFLAQVYGIIVST